MHLHHSPDNRRKGSYERQKPTNNKSFTAMIIIKTNGMINVFLFKKEDPCLFFKPFWPQLLSSEPIADKIAEHGSK